MPSLFKKILRIPEPIGEAKPFCSFDPSQTPIDHEKVAVESDAWRIDASSGKETVRMFELTEGDLGQSLITYRASLKTEIADSRAFLELCCELPGKGEFAQQGASPATAQSTEWAVDEVPVYFKKGMVPDRIELRVNTVGPGRVWIKDIEVLQTPMSL